MTPAMLSYLSAYPLSECSILILKCALIAASRAPCPKCYGTGDALGTYHDCPVCLGNGISHKLIGE